ncbi:MAG: metallophosphoesterase [Candidatus Thorarchaeota archaeon]
MTIIGILSDTHDNLIAIKRAVEVFKAHDVEMVFHAGDFVAPFALLPLFEFPCRLVLGNNDGEIRLLRKRVKEHSDSVLEGVLLIEEINGKRIALTHGHHTQVFTTILTSGSFDVVISGHTHQQKDEVLSNQTLHINPGEGGGWISGRASVAILDLTSLERKFINTWQYNI